MEPDLHLNEAAEALAAAQALAATVFPSAVSVEWTYTTGGQTLDVGVSAGSVLHKSANHTYILSFLPITKLKPKMRVDLVVHFHDEVEMKADVLFTAHDALGFTVLRTEAAHESSAPIQFSDAPLVFSTALCVAPKTKSSFHKVDGFIPTPSCAANNMAGIVPEITKDYFIFVCQHRDTQIMKSAPVFNENSQVNGFVIQDCSLPFAPGDKPGEVFFDKEAKICVKPRQVEAWLRVARDYDDWRVGLEL